LQLNAYLFSRFEFTETRNAREKIRAMRSEPAELEAFLLKWRRAITNQSDLWEGPRAVGELGREAGYLDFILCKPAGRLPSIWMLRGVLGEVKDYREQKEIWQKEFRDTEIFLAKIAQQSARARGQRRSS